MRRSRQQGLVLASSLALAAGLPAAAGLPSASAHPPGVRVTTVLTGLNAPRGITFDGRGAMYVAQSGVIGQGAAGMTRSGSVTKYTRRASTVAWQHAFRSLFITVDPSAPPDVLGPEGLSSLGESCEEDACPISLIMSESTEGVSAATGGAVVDPQAGHLFRLDAATGRARDVADVGHAGIAFTTAHPDAKEPNPDSNPFGVLTTRIDGRVRTFVADAGANILDEVRPDGSVRVVAKFPDDPIRDAVPTCVAQGPDGSLLVGTLDLVDNFAAGGGVSKIWRVDPDASYPTPPTVWATGLTTVTSCTVAHGALYATELFGPTTAPPFGDVVKVPLSHPDRLTHIGAPGQIPLPGGIAEGPDDALYVTTNTAAPAGAGGVVRIGLEDD